MQPKHSQQRTRVWSRLRSRPLPESSGKSNWSRAGYPTGFNVTKKTYHFVDALGCKRLHRGGSGWMVCECGLTRLCEAHHGLREQVIEEGICICPSLRVIAKKQRVICSIRPRPTPSTSQTGPNGAVSGPCYPNSQETQLRDDPPAVVHSTISIPRRVVEEAMSDIQQDAI